MADLSTPLPIGGLTMRNRIVMPPMANNLADERGGSPIGWWSTTGSGPRAAPG